MIRRLNLLLAVAFLALGVALLVATALAGGGQVGVLMGLVFLALGALRLRALRGR